MGRKVRCLSCRKLKIGCDAARPSCEYCLHTNRKCVYPEPKPPGVSKKIKNVNQPSKVNGTGEDHEIIEINQGINEINVSEYSGPISSLGDGEGFDDLVSLSDSDPQTFLNSLIDPSTYTVDSLEQSHLDVYMDQRDTLMQEYNIFEATLYEQGLLNSNYKYLGISKFEYRLLNTFEIVYIGRGDEDILKSDYLSPVDRILYSQLPQLWHSSLVIKQTIYSVSTMFLNDNTNILSIVHEDLMCSGEMVNLQASELEFLEAFGFQNNGDEQNLNYNLDTSAFGNSNVTDKTLKYFNSSLLENNKLLAGIISDESNFTVETAVEALLSTILLFSFLSLQPYRLVKLISFSNEETDMVRISLNMKSVMVRALRRVHNTRYEGFTYLSDLFGVPQTTEEYPLVQELQKLFHDKYKMTYNREIQEEVQRLIDYLNINIHRSIYTKDAAHLSRWIFTIGEKVGELMETGNFFCLKLLYYYSCVTIFCGLIYKRYQNMYFDFILWYKQRSFDLYGDWELGFDTILFQLVLFGFTVAYDLSSLRHVSSTMEVSSNSNRITTM